MVDINKNINVAIVYHYVAHYRKPVFDALCSDENINFYIVADESSNIESISTLSSDESNSSKIISSRWISVKNFWLTENILWQRGLLSICFSKKFDTLILLGNMYFLSTWVAAFLARVCGKKIYFWTHGYLNNEKGVKSFFRNLFYKMSDGLLLYGNNAKNILIKKGFSEKKLHVIYNSLDFDLQSQLISEISSQEISDKKKSLGIKDYESLIIASGRLTKGKRFDLLVDLIKKINTQGKNCKLLIIGEGPEKEKIISYSKSCNVESKIIFFGACYDEKLLSLLYSISDVCVVPGDIGLSAIHSLSYGLPVVTHDDFSTHKPEFEAITDGLNGSFYKKDDLSDLAIKVSDWLDRDNLDTFDKCREPIKKFYNPQHQVYAIKSILERDINFDKSS